MSASPYARPKIEVILRRYSRLMALGAFFTTMLWGCGTTPTRSNSQSGKLDDKFRVVKQAEPGQKLDIAFPRTQLPCRVDGKWTYVDVFGSFSALPETGDVVQVDSHTVVWPGGPCKLVTSDQDLFLERADGQTLIATGTGLYERSSALAPVTVGELRGLDFFAKDSQLPQGFLVPENLCISVSSHGVSKRLKELPDALFESSCLVVDGEAESFEFFAKFRKLKTLILGVNTGHVQKILEKIGPDVLETLVVSSGQGRPKTLARFTNLKSLTIHSIEEEKFSLSFVSSMRDLRMLVVDSPKVVDTESLATLQRLQRLELRGLVDNQSIVGIANNTSLVDLVLRGDIQDLRPLAGLEKLVSIDANHTRTAYLPNGRMPALREFSLLATPVSDEVAQVFAEANPRCTFQYRFKQSIDQRVGSADRVRVVQSERCGSGERAGYIVKGEAVRELLAAIEPNEASAKGMIVGCRGDTLFEFFRGDKKLGELSYFSSSGTLQFSGWLEDVSVTKASHQAIREWLARQSAPAFRVPAPSTRN